MAFFRPEVACSNEYSSGKNFTMLEPISVDWLKMAKISTLQNKTFENLLMSKTMITIIVITQFTIFKERMKHSDNI